MAVFYVERTHNYLVMSNYHLPSRMRSLSEDRDYTLACLGCSNAEGMNVIRAAVNVPEQAWYA